MPDTIPTACPGPCPPATGRWIACWVPPTPTLPTLPTVPTMPTMPTVPTRAPPRAPGHAAGRPPSDHDHDDPDPGPGHGHGPDHSHGLDLVLPYPGSLASMTPPSPEDPLLGDDAVKAALQAADPALIHALLRSISPALGGTGLDVLAMGRTARTATPTQVLGLTVRDRGCSVPGCTRPARWCQSDHAIPWAAGGRTDLSNLQLLCGTHHREKTLRENRLRAAGTDRRG